MAATFAQANDDKDARDILGKDKKCLSTKS